MFHFKQLDMTNMITLFQVFTVFKGNIYQVLTLCQSTVYVSLYINSFNLYLPHHHKYCMYSGTVCTIIPILQMWNVSMYRLTNLPTT